MIVHKHPVPEAFAAQALVKAADYQAMYQESLRDPSGFWARIAKRIDWMRFPTRIKDVSFDPADFRVRWYEDGELNVSVNCLDRQLAQRGDKTALLFEGDDPSVSRRISYRELYEQVCRFGNALRTCGVKKGDRVTIYMPMIPKRRSRCSPARASARCIPSCSAASPRIAGGTHSRLRVHDRHHRGRGPARRQEDSAESQRGRGDRLAPPAGEECRRRAAHWRGCRLGARARCVVRGDHRRGNRRPANPSGWTRRIRCSSFIRPARPGSRRVCCTPAAAISCSSISRSPTCSTTTRKTSSGARPTSAGSPATATSCTARCRTARPA